MNKIRIASAFSEVPLGRYPSDGEFSGERFREEFLKPALEEGGVIVQIDGTEGYGSSFLEEAFGGLVRKGYYTPVQLHERLEIETADPGFEVYSSLIWKYIDDAGPLAAR
ncbi:MAG TPA: STAS-like domain-containing protein [Chthoniobacterales bacterium]